MNQITRRNFLKKSIAVTSSFSVVGFGNFLPTLPTNIQCKKCGSEHTQILYHLTQPGCGGFCGNCGAHLKSGVFLKNASCKFACSPDTAELNRGSACIEVPFPNHALAIKTDKPYLDLSELRF